MMAQKEGCSIDKKDCCSNKTILIQSDQDQQIQTSEFVSNQHLKQFVVAYVAVFFTSEFNIEREVVAFAEYIPPLIPRDIPVLNQTFLL